ncbi:MAG TPA: tRNA (N6-threonylcarbamoyladenosine(37)-N6)-methyltransferase TrmO [Caldilineae bacterium]|nr:tRNA (N6-threonylcarbamoyladenosine(37)-N6)-methyltransferase TrmO [Caldilineae bacterium]
MTHPTATESEPTICFHPIGVVENEFDQPAPGDAIRAAESLIRLKPALAPGLDGLKPGERLLVLFHFHRSQGFQLHQHPRGDRSRPRRGVFALRSPFRPNAIGASVVEIIAIDNNLLRVRGLDAIDGTPVLDLKPV